MRCALTRSVRSSPSSGSSILVSNCRSMSSSAASNSSSQEITAAGEKPGPSSSRVGLMALAFLMVAFLADAAWFSRQLPPRVATHFDFHGQADGWMTRADYRKFTIVVGIATPLLVLGVFALVR